MENPEIIDSKKLLNFETFWKSNEATIIKNIKNLAEKNHENDDESDEKVLDVDKYLQKEKEFCKTVMEGIKISLEASKELKEKHEEYKAILLFDIDDTIGKSDVYSKSKDFQIRPSFELLMKNLKDHSDIEIGILSSRSLDALQKQQINSDIDNDFSDVGHYFNSDYVFSSKDFDEQNFSDNAKLYFPKLIESTELKPAMGVITKINALSHITSADPDKFYILIDDILGLANEDINSSDRVINVHNCMPGTVRKNIQQP